MLSKQVDLVVLGAGAAGMMGALAAAERGLQVILIDPHSEQSNNFAISGGLFPAAGSSLQAKAGVLDSPDDWLADLRAFSGSSLNERIAVSVANALPEVVNFLINELDGPIQFLSDVVSTGHTQCRFHSSTPSGGKSFHQWFRTRSLNHPSIEFSSRLAIVEKTAQGFFVSTPDRHWQTRHLMLAGGGFGSNPQWVSQHIPSMRGALYNGAPNNDASVLALGLQWGGYLSGMDGFQGQGHAHPGGVTRLGMAIPALGGIMVNRMGERFVREDIGPSALAPYVMAQPGGLALEVFDAHIETGLKNHSAYQEAVQAQRVIRADDVSTLAALADVDLHGLQATLDSVQNMAQGLSADALGRESFTRVFRSPYLASWVTGALSHTQGGLVTDGDGRVCAREGQSVNGLWAAGGCAAGLSGQGAEGYLPGNGLAQSFGLAWRMAQSLD